MFHFCFQCAGVRGGPNNKSHTTATIRTQNIQGALVVGDDDIGPLRLQMLPPAHLKSKAQQILHMTNHEADDPEGGEVQVGRNSKFGQNARVN